MFWNKKDDKRLPDIPDDNLHPIAPVSRKDSHDEKEDLDDLHYEKQSLPSLPDTAAKRGFSQTIIKDAVLPEVNNKPEEIKLNPTKNFKMTEYEDDEHPMIKSMHAEHEEEDEQLGLPPQNDYYAASYPPRQDSGKKQDVFVKIDKYYTAKKTLDEVKGQVADIEEVLKKIRETKLREEQELTSWEKEMSEIKGKIKEINEGIFEKVE